MSIFKKQSVAWTPHVYQKKAVKFLLEHACAALLLDPGLGKTSITLAAIRFLKKKGVINKVLLLAPLRVAHSVWPKEVEKWTDFKGLKVVVLHGPNKDELLKTEADVYVTNYESLDWLLAVKKTKKVSVKTGKTITTYDVSVPRFKKFGFDTLVIDELSKLKSTRSGRFKTLKTVLGTFSKRWGLTGSPAANGLMDLFGQCFCLDQGRTLGQYITHYQMEYFDKGQDGFSWVLREGSEDKIYKRLAPLALRMADTDYLDVPMVVENNIYIDLPDKTRRVYDQLEEDLITMLEEGVVTASTAATASMKIRQVCSGGLYLDAEVSQLVKAPKSARKWVNLHTEKVDALADLIDELQGSPLLVAYDFEHDLDRLMIKFGKDIPYIGGGVSTARSNKLKTAWNRGELPVLFGHPKSIAHGLNLQEAGFHVCWHSPTWNYEEYDQFIRRVKRQGNKSKKIFVHHILARDTIDEVMLEVLKVKRKGQNALFDALKKLSRRRK